MSYQDRIYNQNAKFSRNSTSPVHRTSSDICVFDNPIVNMVNGDKINCASLNYTIGSVNFNEILTNSLNCFIDNDLSGSCFNNLNWFTRVYEDDDLVYDKKFYTTTSLTGGTPSIDVFSGSVTTAFNELGYNYELSGSTYIFEQINGVSNLKLIINTEIDYDEDCEVTGGTTGLTFTGVCDNVETIINDETFSGLSASSINVFAISDENSIDLLFNFSGSNTTSLFETDANFKFEIYKFNKILGFFKEPAIYASPLETWSSISGTSAYTHTVPIDDLDLDGDYLIKGYYVYKNCTEFANLLGLNLSTESVKLSDEYRLYNSFRDYHFVALKTADRPIIEVGDDSKGDSGVMKINTQVLPGGTNDFKFPESNGDVIVTLNGLTLANELDYAIVNEPVIGDVIRLSGETYEGDVLTVTYNSSVLNDDVKFKKDVIDILEPIPEGPIDKQGDSAIYFNTTTKKYEAFTEITPLVNNEIAVTLNGIRLGNGLDYYQSSSNPNRIIFEGEILEGDIINIWYNAGIRAQGDIFNNIIIVDWRIATAPAGGDGKFYVELAKDKEFTNIINVVEVEYVAGQIGYDTFLGLKGNNGDKLYYRVRNRKKYVDICGAAIFTTSISDIIDITLQTNSINSY